MHRAIVLAEKNQIKAFSSDDADRKRRKRLLDESDLCQIIFLSNPVLFFFFAWP